MKKNCDYDSGGTAMSQLKLNLLKMKLTFLCLILGVFQLMASQGFSQSTRLTLNLKDVKVEDVLMQIEEQTDYYFIYNREVVDVSRKVNVNCDSKDVSEILSDIFKESNVSVEIQDRHIILKSVIASSQQKLKLTGKVTDTSGQPLPGVTVVVKGTTNGTITNFDGFYNLSDVPSDGTIQFSFVGMRMQEIPIAGKTTIDVVMEEDAIGIEEVVAVGYGTMRRSDLTGAVGSVKASEIIKAPVKSFDEAIAGRVAGVQISSDDGQPGSLPNIVIRGANSITGENSPLYVIDGFPIEDNDNNDLNPNDIESIDILKDASATAIYGARGANGVIMITTKRGKIGAPVISYNGYYGFRKEVKKIETLSPYEFVKLNYERYPTMTENYYLSDVGKTLEDYKNEEGIDWYDKATHYAPIHNHSLSISGGNKKNRYSASFSYLDQKGVFINTGFNRYQGRLTLDQKISEKLDFGVNVNYSSGKNYGVVATDGNGSLSLMYSIWSYRPVNPDPDVDLEFELNDPSIDPTSDYRVNPILQLEHELRERISNNLITNADLNYKILKNLKFKFSIGVKKDNYQMNEFSDSQTRTGNPTSPQYKGVNGRQTYTNRFYLNNANTLTWNKVFNKKHKLNIVGGFTQQKSRTTVFGAKAVLIANESFGVNGLDDGTPTLITARQTDWSLQSYLFRVNYDYKSKYLITASARADGSSRFSKENRWGYFPSAALAYRLSSEDFIKDIGAISDAKIRISYGATGNNRVGDFATLSSIVTTSTSGYAFGNTAASKGTYPSSLGNSDLKWETTTQFNAGLDLSLFKNRLAFTGEYYYKKTSDLLLYADIPNYSGYSSVYKNIGEVSNSGLEFVLNTVNFKRTNFKWTSSFNISFNRNKILSLVEGQESITSTIYAKFSGITHIAKVGRPIALFYAAVFDGLYGYDDFDKLTDGTYVLKDGIPTSYTANRTLIQPGYAKYRDIDGDGAISTNDYTVIGDPNPDFIGGFNNNFEYNNFDLSILLQFSYGNDILNLNTSNFNGGAYTIYNTNAYATYADRWTEENPTGNIPRVGDYANMYSSRYVEDGSFLRLKTISLGYNFNEKLLSTVKIKSARIYASAQNLFTLTKYSGIDPEVSTRRSALTPGVDLSPYPQMKTITLGLNVKF